MPHEAQVPATPALVIQGRVIRFDADIERGGQGEAGVVVTALNFAGDVLDSDTTDAAGNYSLTPTTGTTGFFRIGMRKGTRLGAFTFSGNFGVVARGESVITRDFVAHRPTIVMMAGYTGIHTPKSSCPQTIPGQTAYQPGVCPSNAFDSEEGSSFAESLPQELMDEGYHVHIAVMNSTIMGTPSLANQVPVIRTAIDRAKAVTGTNKVIILAHSMGGIVSRRYIESDSYRDDVSHLFTFGSPHLGAPIERISAILMPVISLLGGGLAMGASFVVFCGSQQAACDVSEAGMALFNLSFRPRAGVTYHIIQGDAVRMRTCFGPFNVPFPCAHPNNAELTGLGPAIDAINNGDGLINENSINLQGTHDRLRTFDAHGWDFGNPWYLQRTGTRRGEAYNECIRPVFIQKETTICGTVRAPSALTPNQTITETVGAQFAPLQSGRLAAGETISHTVGVVDDGYPATFIANWGRGAPALTLRMPDGTHVDPAYAAANPGVITYTATATYALYEFARAPRGHYTMQLQAQPADPATAYTFMAGFQSNYRLLAARNRNWYGPGETAVITATLRGEPIVAPTVTAYIARPDGITDTLPLTAGSNGQYAANYLVPDAPGYAQLQVIATGTVTGTTLTRARTLNFQIYPHSFKLSGAYSESKTREALTINVGLNVTQAGPARVTGILASAATGAEVAIATTITEVMTGTTNVALRFDGQTIADSGINGPYRLRRVVVVDERSTALVTDDKSNVYATAAHSARDFGPIRLFLPLTLLRTLNP